MTYSTVSHWNTTKWTDEMEAGARDKFVPLVMSAGAKLVRMVRTGDLSFCVITDYVNGKTCEAGQAKIAEIRAQASTELSMTMASSEHGLVFARGG